MLNPGSTDSTAVFALLQVISNPDLAKKNLSELKKLSDDLNDKQQALQDTVALTKKLEAEQAEIDKSRNDLEARVNDYNQDKATLDVLAQQLSGKLSEFEKNVKETSSDLSSQKASLDSKEAAVSARESVVEANIFKTADSLASAEASRKAIESKLQQMKAIAG